MRGRRKSEGERINAVCCRIHEGPYQALGKTKEIDQQDPRRAFWSRKFFNTINDLEPQGPGPFILLSA